MLPIPTRTGGWGSLARPDRQWCGFREVGLVLSTANRDPELVFRGSHGDSAVLEVWRRPGECMPSSDTEGSSVPSMTRTQAIEQVTGSRKRAQPISSKMHIAGETQDDRRVREALALIPAEQRIA